VDDDDDITNAVRKIWGGESCDFDSELDLCSVFSISNPSIFGVNPSLELASITEHIC
jgi:hypothetical protein